MGNVPISCCRSRSPGPGDGIDPQEGGARNGVSSKYSSSNSQESRRKHSNKLNKDAADKQNPDNMAFAQNKQPNMLQHISEREPDDSETDPSYSVLNRPIFAARNSGSRHSKLSTSGNYIDSYSSSNSLSARKQSSGPLTSSQDQGYNSCAEPNICTSTHTNGGTILTNDSFGCSIQRDNILQQQVVSADEFDSSLRLDDKTSPISGMNNKTLLKFTTSSPLNILDEIRDDIETTRDSESRLFNRQQLENSGRNNSRTLLNNRLKASSCSTIFIDDSTISQPDLDQTIKCVSMAIHYHIKNRSSDNTSDIFDESIHPFKTTPCQGAQVAESSAVASANRQQAAAELIILDSQKKSSQHTQPIQEPDQTDIYKFVRTLFKSAQLTSEYAITTLVYLERLMAYGEIDLTPKTWRRMFLGAILLSSKVWEDQAVWNVDYAQILDEISVDDINELERQYLELIQFNMNVPSSVYAKYYFHLRTLALKNGLSENQTLMSVSKAKQLEAMSRLGAADDYLSSPIHRKSPPAIKKHTSLEKLRLSGQVRAVLM